MPAPWIEIHGEAGFDAPWQIGLNVAASAWGAYLHLPRQSKVVSDDLTPNERLSLEHRPEYADKLLQPKNRAMLTRLAENYAAHRSPGAPQALARQDQIQEVARIDAWWQGGGVGKTAIRVESRTETRFARIHGNEV